MKKPFVFHTRTARPSNSELLRLEVSRLTGSGERPKDRSRIYSAEEDNTIRRMHRAGSTLSEIAAALGRSQSSVRVHAKQYLFINLSKIRRIAG